MLNQCIFMGRFTREPSLTQSKAGKPICRFAIAVDNYDAETRSQKPIFVDCSCFGVKAETISKCFHKGKPIIVSGRLTRYDVVAQDGNKRTNDLLIVNDFEFVSNEKPEKQTEAPFGGSAENVGVKADQKQANGPFGNEDIDLVDDDLGF